MSALIAFVGFASGFGAATSLAMFVNDRGWIFHAILAAVNAAGAVLLIARAQ